MTWTLVKGRSWVSVTLTSRLPEDKECAWDGHTLRLEAAVEQPATLRLKFSKRAGRFASGH
jgi:hypothetical protein